MPLTCSFPARALSRRLARTLVAALLLGLAASPALALRLKHRTLDPAPGSLVFTSPSPSFRGAGSHLLVKVKGPLATADREACRRQGLDLLQPLGEGVWIAGVKGQPAPGSLPVDLDWATPIEPADKRGPGVASGRYASYSLMDDGRRVLQVVFHRDVDLERAGEWLRSLGLPTGSVIRTTHTWLCAADEAETALLLDTDEVLWVQETTPPLQSTNNGSRTRTHADIVQAPPYNFRGEGTTVTVYDGGLVETGHAAFGGRAVVGASESGSVADHPTHVAGSVGCNHATYFGMAPACDIVSYEYEACDPNCLYDSPSDIEADHAEAIGLYDTDVITVSLGANIYSNGYPCDWQGDYENTSALIDGIVDGALGRPVIMTWAAGNERSGGSCGLTYESMSVPSGAKNPIIVGATVKNTSDTMTGFSSWGPTDDGRVKPDICAPGENIVSTVPGGGTGTMSGTSMATPITAGCVAQLVQAWRAYVPGADYLSPALAKTLLVQTADDRGNTGPDYQYGYGRINVEEAVDAVRFGQYLEDRVSQGVVREYTVTVAPGTSRLQVSLGWTDWPGAYLDVAELVDNLDLELVSPTQVGHDPWVLNPASPGTAATTGTDALNNVEQVTVLNPESGTWTLRVTGTSIALDEQDFALAADVTLQEGNTGVIAGTVMSDGDPVPVSAIVRAMDLPAGTVADADGFYALRLPLGRPVTIQCAHQDYLPVEAQVIAATDTIWVDFTLAPRPLAVLSLGVHNGGTPIPQATVTLSNEFGSYGTHSLDDQGQVSLDLPGGTVYNVLVACSRDDSLYTGLALPQEGAAYDLQLQGLSFLASDVDASGYLMVDQLDLHPLAPAWEWIEIDPANGGTGTILDFTGDDQTFVVDLPFTFTHYGQDYTQLSICGNGWVSMGATTEVEWRGDNGVPDAVGPPAIIAPFWEDLSPQQAASGNICWQYLSVDGLFVVQFSSIRQFAPVTAFETFQVVLMDPAVYPTNTGNGQILFQYGELTDISEIAVGIENEAEDQGLLVFNNGEYHPNAPAIAQGTAILFTSVPSAGAARGQVVLFPEDADLLAQVRVAVPGDTTGVDTQGNWLLDDLMPGQRPFRLIGPAGVETLVRVGTVPVADTLDIGSVTLWQLGSPENSQVVAVDGPQVTLAWQAPAWQTDTDGGSVTGKDARVDEFHSWRVYRRDTGAGGQTFVRVGNNIADTTFTETLALPGQYHYHITGNYDGGESLPGDELEVVAEFTDLDPRPLPAEFYLSEAWPNPFNSSTGIRFGLPQPSQVRVAVYNLLGQQVQVLHDGPLGAGHHQLHWDASRFASGAYLIEYRDERGPQVRRLLQVK